MKAIVLLAVLVAGQAGKPAASLEGTYRVKYVAPAGSRSAGDGSVGAYLCNADVALQC